MSDVTLDDVLPQTPGKPPPARPPIQDISQWSERFCLIAGILATRFPLKASELFAYHASIIHVERNYEKYRWVAYDRQYRREALARKDLNWSAENSRLYTMRPSLGEPKRSHGVRSAYRTTTPTPFAPVIPTSRSLDGSPTRPIGTHRQCRTANPPRKSVATIIKGGARSLPTNAAIHTFVTCAPPTTLPSTAPETEAISGDGTVPHHHHLMVVGQAAHSPARGPIPPDPPNRTVVPVIGH